MDESNNVLVEDTENERTVAVYEWVEAAIFALVCVVLVFTFLFRIVGVDGESMQTTLMDHDRLILTRLNWIASWRKPTSMSGRTPTKQPILSSSS